MKNRNHIFPALLGFALVSASPLPAAPGSKPAEMGKPVQVFILLGQSNMVGAGHVKGGKEGNLTDAVKKENLYPFLIDTDGNWAERKDVRYVHHMKGKIQANTWMGVPGGKIGPELGIGHQLGNAIDAPVLILKSCIGNRSLGWDLLPPGSESYEAEGKAKGGGTKTFVYPAYKESPMKWEKGTAPEPIGWYAGKQYDDDTAGAKEVLADLATFYPGADDYEIAGFLFWQGDKDRYDQGHAAKYEENLVNFINALRKDFNAPKAKFVCATLGQTAKDGAKGNDALIFEAQMAVDGESGKYPEFKGNVATVYSHPLSQGGASNGHYGGNAKTYMDVRLAMGEKIAELLRN